MGIWLLDCETLPGRRARVWTTDSFCWGSSLLWTIARSSCGKAFIFDGECRELVGTRHAAQESLGQGAESEQVFRPSDDGRVVREFVNRGLEVGPVRGYQ